MSNSNDLLKYKKSLESRIQLAQDVKRLMSDPVWMQVISLKFMKEYPLNEIALSEHMNEELWCNIKAPNILKNFLDGILEDAEIAESEMMSFREIDRLS